jgi:hypothetical protein
MVRFLTAIVAVIGLCPETLPLVAQEAPNAKLLGTWAHSANGYKTVIDIKPEGLHVTFVCRPEGATVSVHADYLVTRDGLLVVANRMYGVGKSKKAEDELKNRLYVCHFSLQGDSLIISRFGELKVLAYSEEGYQAAKTTNLDEIIEGTYQRVQSKNNAARGKGSPRPGEVNKAQCDQNASPKPSTETRDTSSSTPTRRMGELLNASEQSGPIGHDVKSIKIPDKPSDLTPERVHGGIQ